MTRLWMGLTLGIGLAACGGTPPFGGDATEPGGSTAAGAVFLTDESEDLTLNNVSYNAATDTLTLNNIPFDDPNNAYERIATEAFTNGFDAYQSAPAAGSQELQYFAVFRRSDSGRTQVAAAGTGTYISFGFGGAGAQRLSVNPSLPNTGIYTYAGEYAGVRTTIVPGAPSNTVEYVTGDADLAADFNDFDVVGNVGNAVGGTIENRQVYDTDGVLIGALAGYLTLANGSIDRSTGTILSSTVSEVVGGTIVRSGNWNGVLAGPGGTEIAGVLFVEGDDIRETGGFISNCVDTPPTICP
jgi:hypothetical protein